MRITDATFVVALLLTAFTSGCSRHGYAQGSASYTSTPQIDAHSGALPLESLVCIDASPKSYRRGVGISLGGSCRLVGAYEAHRTRGSPGGMASLVPDGVCALPTAASPIPVTVANATLEVNADAVDVTVGGTTARGQYVTYRFTGVIGENDAETACQEVMGASW